MKQLDKVVASRNLVWKLLHFFLVTFEHVLSADSSTLEPCINERHYCYFIVLM